MAAYPSYSIALESSHAQENTYSDDFAIAGSQHSRLLHDKQYTVFSVIHPGLTGQQYADLLATYNAGPRDTFTGFTWYTSSPAVTYSVKFTAPPQIVTAHGGDKYDVGVSLRGWVV